MTIYDLVLYIAIAAGILGALRYFLAPQPRIWVAYVQDFVGSLFIFSGFVKAIDPLGTAYKMMDYFNEFGMGFLEPLTLSFAVFMIVLEIMLGVALILGYRMKLTTWLLFLMIVFFTFLTGYTTVTGHVTDCGCFGDFLKLEPIVTFSKDLVLLVLILIIMFNRDKIEKLFPTLFSTIIVASTGAVFLIYCFSNFYTNLPQFDFRPYAVGKNVPDQMTVAPEDRPVIEFIYIYTNPETGEEKEFDPKELPSKPWTYKDRIDKVVKEGKTPKIDNFQLFEGDEQVQDDILYNPDYNFWVVAYDLEKTDKKAFKEQINPLAEKAQAAGYMVYGFTAATTADTEAFRHDVQAAYPFYAGDATFLKTIVRASPGLVLVKDGTVLGKWHHKHLPTYEEVEQTLMK